MSVTLEQTYLYEETASVKWTRFGTGPPVIFCHGTPWSSQLWMPFATCLSDRFEIYMYDMPGYGESITTSTEDWEPSYPFQTGVFSALFKYWANGKENFRPHIVAHDIGGHVALRAHQILALPYSSLIIFDCGASVPVDEPFFSLVRENVSTFLRLPSHLHQALLREYIRSASYKGLTKKKEDMLVQPWITTQGQEAFYRQIAAQKNSDIEDLQQRLTKLTIPIHIVWAKNDAWVPVERAHTLQAVIGGTLKIIEDSGHLIQLDRSEVVMAELLKWLAQNS